MSLDNLTDAPIADAGAIDPAVVPPAIAAPADAADAADEYNAEDFYADDQPQDDGNPAADADPDALAAADPADEPIEAPLSWAKDAKEQFAKLPREAQEIIATRERDREVALQAKFREAASTRQQVETEARSALQTIMTNHQQALEVALGNVDIQQPDLRLLNSPDPAHRDLYFQQEAQYRAAVAQRETITQQLQEARQHSETIQLQQQQVELQAEHALLEEKLGTDWSDPSSRAKLLGDLTPIAAELGYPQELIGQARALDILAMKTASDWKAKAEKWDAYNKAKMVPVRQARGNPIPPTARPVAPNGNRQPVSIEAQLYPDDVRRN